MNYKHVSVSDGVSIAVPDNLSPEEETLFIAKWLAFVNLEELEAEGRRLLEMEAKGELLPMEDVLAELAKDSGQSKEKQ